jgi:hypothetical protein
MNTWTSAELATDGESDEILLELDCDIWIIGLTSGAVKIQVKFPGEPSFRDAPSGSYTADVMKTIYQAEHGVRYKMVGVGNNAGVYIRMAKATRRSG